MQVHRSPQRTPGLAPFCTHIVQVLERGQRLIYTPPEDGKRDESRHQTQGAPGAAHDRLDYQQHDAHRYAAEDDAPQAQHRPRRHAPSVFPPIGLSTISAR